MPDDNNNLPNTQGPQATNPLPDEASAKTGVPPQPPVPEVSETPAVPEPVTPTFPSETDFPPPPPSVGIPEAGDLPPIISPPAKKFGGKKMVATILGVLLLVASLGAGIVLVKQQQDIREKASIAEPCKVCDGGDCEIIGTPPDCTPSLNECSSNADCGPGPTPEPECKKKDELCAKFNTTFADCCGTLECKWVVGLPPDQKKCVGESVPTPTPTPTQHCPYDCLQLRECGEHYPNKETSLGWGDCGAALGEHCCKKISGPTSTPTSKPKPKTPTPTPTATPTPTTTPIADCWECNISKQCVFRKCTGGQTCKSKTDCAKTPTPSPSYPPIVLGRCVGIIAYGSKWNPLVLGNPGAANTGATIKVGDKIYFAVKGEEGTGEYNEAKFLINGTEKSPTGTEKGIGFYIEYIIKKTDVGKSISVKAKIHNTVLGWSEY